MAHRRHLLGRWRLALVISVAATVIALAASVASCGPACRDIDTWEMSLECTDGRRFTGELHFDSAETFDTFLTQQCISTAPSDDVARVADDVVWDKRAVFVAVGPAAIDSRRCVTSRKLDRAQVCDDGLKVFFLDEYIVADDGCNEPRWTVAFQLRREDMRAALDAPNAE